MSSKIAVIKTGGKQYRVSEGQTLKVEKLDQKEGQKVKFDTLLVASDDGQEFNVGQPSLGEKTEGKVIEHGKGPKREFAKFKNKIRQRKKVSHRQPYTKIEISSIKTK